MEKNERKIKIVNKNQKTLRLLRIIVIAATVLLFGVSLLILISSRSTLEIYLSDEWQAGDCVPDSDIVEISEIDDKANKISINSIERDVSDTRKNIKNIDEQINGTKKDTE